MTTLVILDKGSVDHVKYIERVLLVAKKCGDEMMGNDRILQQDNAPAHKDSETQQWCRDKFTIIYSTRALAY
ncbi:unnamed protein product [Didymodactylos carnosus]|uniref:Tc1-like transposase DDE domain-containing protein n=1 Tax=Didymodactylos carnosus TaxID=1234261 RepID=A0A8S2L3E4_9BILA|nr:unnamed protein product [Didymodactylos carnosus]